MAVLSMVSSCSAAADGLQDGREIIYSISATVMTKETRMGITDDCMCAWEETDRIAVLNNGEKAMFETSQNGPSAVFHGELPVSEGHCFWGVYPYSADIAGTDDKVTLTLPDVQTVSASSYSNIVRIAKSSSAELYFKSACACLKFKLSQPGITRMTIRCNGLSSLAGEATFTWDDDLPSIAGIADPCDIVSVIPEGGEFEPDCWYYVAVLPTASEQYTMTFEKGNMLGSVTKGPYSFKRNTNAVLEYPDLDAEWTGKVLEYDFSTSPNWDLCAIAEPENVEYQVVDAEGHYAPFIFSNCYSGNSNGKYLVISRGYLGLPELDGYRLSAVEMTLGNHNTKRYISVNSDKYPETVISGNCAQTLVSAATESVRFELPHTIEGQRYWLYSSTSFVLAKLKLWYEPAKLRLEDVDKVIERAIADETVPGAILGVWKDGAVVYRKAYGNKSITPYLVPMTADVVFDMASCTKVLSTTMAVMQLYEQGLIDFNEKISSYLDEFDAAEPITLVNLMTHTSGLVRASTNYKLYKGDPQGFLEQTVLGARSFLPGEKYKYDCINFFMLQQIVERLAGKRLCEYARDNIFGPLGMYDTMYLPTDQMVEPEYQARIAPTSSDPSLTGQVNDTMARVVSLGNAGNAGVFSTVDDVLRFGRMILAGGILDGQRVLQESTVTMMSEEVMFGRTLGWDCLSPTGYEKGSFVSETAIFHTGYCGTMLVVDRDNNMCIALMANRPHPQNTGYAAWNRYRGLICDIIGASLCRQD